LSRIEHIRLLADYNEWMNVKLYEAAAALPADEVLADRYARGEITDEEYRHRASVLRDQEQSIR